MQAMKSPNILEQIKIHLMSRSITFREVHHEPMHTSEESAKARGEDISIRGKAILMKMDEEFKLFVLSAAKKIDSPKIKARLIAIFVLENF